MTSIVRLLSLEIGLSEDIVRDVMQTAPVRYKTFFIPKRDGTSRKISQPAREVKLLQRAFVKSILQRLPVHSAATAYISGKGLLDNVRPHAASGPILKMDLTNFFPSIRRIDWIKYCEKNSVFQSAEDIELSSYLLFHKSKNSRVMRLAIGAPSSPMLSNVLMFDFDNQIEHEVSKEMVVYTRYADDLTFSAPRTGHLVNVVKLVARTIRKLKNPSLSINTEKTRSSTLKYKRSVTGLIIANDGRITIGRAQKRIISAKLHHAISKNIENSEMEYLSGYLSYIKSVDPEFIFKLQKKILPASCRCSYAV
jgi:hypothetical protein